jgi:serine/threonine protein phosphatase PrpC
MEDQYGIEHLNGDQTSLYFSIFDGHGGQACAKFCASIFPRHVSKKERHFFAFYF